MCVYIAKTASGDLSGTHKTSSSAVVVYTLRIKFEVQFFGADDVTVCVGSLLGYCR